MRGVVVVVGGGILVVVVEPQSWQILEQEGGPCHQDEVQCSKRAQGHSFHPKALRETSMPEGGTQDGWW